MLKQGRSVLLALAATATATAACSDINTPIYFQGETVEAAGDDDPIPFSGMTLKFRQPTQKEQMELDAAAGRARLRHARPLDLARQGPHRGLVQGHEPLRPEGRLHALDRRRQRVHEVRRASRRRGARRGRPDLLPARDDAAAPARCRRERQRHRARGRLRGRRAGPRCARTLERRRPGEPDVRGRADQPLGGEPDRPEPGAGEPGRPGHVRGRRAAQDERPDARRILRARPRRRRSTLAQ